MKKLEKYKLGFTIVELLLYLGLLTGFLLVLTDIFVSSLDVQKETEAVSPVSQDGQYILDRLVYDASQAQDITTPTTLGQTGNTLQLSVGGSTYTYAVAGGVLNLTVNGVTNALNSFGTTVTNFSATKLGNPGGKPTAQIILTLTSTTQRPGGPESQTWQTTIGVR